MNPLRWPDDLALTAAALWRRLLRGHDRWTTARLATFQARRLAALRRHAYARSPFYRRFHAGLERAPLGDLPILTKNTLLAHFDELVTDPAVRLADLERHVATLPAMAPGGECTAGGSP